MIAFKKVVDGKNETGLFDFLCIDAFGVLVDDAKRPYADGDVSVGDVGNGRSRIFVNNGKNDGRPCRFLGDGKGMFGRTLC